MSGIAGLWQLNQQPIDSTELERMSAVLSHRGRDGQGTWTEGPVGLIHRMLWTTPESLTEQLPFIDANAHLVITADARIDNRSDLMGVLGLASDVPDSQIILAAYQKWGEQCPEKLIGDFVFVIWDMKQHKLFCARDHFGVKPFYYCYKPGKVFAFATEMKGLLVLPEVSRSTNEIAAGDYLSLMFDDQSITFYQDIVRLPPAHSLTMSQNGLQLTAYWKLNPTYELRVSSDAEYIEQYREIFTEAVRCRMRSAFPIASALSGGIDSSSISCVARDIRQQTDGKLMPTYSAIFDQVLESDERPFIQAVLDKGGFEPHFFHGDEVSPFVDFDQILWHQDGIPFFAPQYFLHWAMWGAAQQNGTRVFMDGLIGDNVTSLGIGYLYELAHQWRWIKLAQELSGASQFWSSMPTWKRWWGFVKYHGVKPLIPEKMLQAYRKFRGVTPPTWRPDPIIRSEFVERINLAKRVKVISQTYATYNTEREAHYEMLTSGLISHGFETADKGCAANQIEGRYPFADRRLIEFCLSVPGRMKFHNGYGRLIARNALAHTLPDKIRWRYSKGDVTANFERSLLLYAGERLEQTMTHPTEQATNCVNMATLRKRYEAYVRDHMFKDSLRPFWAAVMFDQVFRQQEGFFLRLDEKEVIAARPA